MLTDVNGDDVSGTEDPSNQPLSSHRDRGIRTLTE